MPQRMDVGFQRRESAGSKYSRTGSELWVVFPEQKEYVQVTALVAGYRRDGHTDVVQKSEYYGMNLYEYDQTVSRRISEDGGLVVKIGDKNQRLVMESLSRLERVEHVYLNSQQEADVYTIVTSDDDPDLVLKIAELYWGIFDQVPTYSFEFQPVPSECFDLGILPSGYVDFGKGATKRAGE